MNNPLTNVEKECINGFIYSLENGTQDYSREHLLNMLSLGLESPLFISLGCSKITESLLFVCCIMPEEFFTKEKILKWLNSVVQAENDSNLVDLANESQGQTLTEDEQRS